MPISSLALSRLRRQDEVPIQYGKSLLIRELVAASEIDYGDCKTFQIICPVCYEPVFKCGAYGDDRQYLSHYPSKSDQNDCELRVAGYRAADVQAMNRIARGQALVEFTKVIREAFLKVGTERIADALNVSVTPAFSVRVGEQVAAGAARRTFRQFMETTASVARQQFDVKWNDLCDRAFADGVIKRWRLDFGRDVLRHLLSVNAITSLLCVSMVSNLVFDAGPTTFQTKSGPEITAVLAKGSERELRDALAAWGDAPTSRADNVPEPGGIKFDLAVNVALYNIIGMVVTFRYENFLGAG